MKKDLDIFEGHRIRRLYDEKTETWWFSVVDIIRVLTQQPDYKAAQNYWKVLKHRLNKEGSQLVINCNQLKLETADGKSYITDVANAETLLRLVQSVPSPKAEPIKLWLAKVGYERMQEMADPARALERARATWQKHGRSDKWIQQRMTGQETRNKLTDYWATHDIKKGDEYAILTNLIHQEWSGVSVNAHKDLKGLKCATASVTVTMRLITRHCGTRCMMMCPDYSSRSSRCSRNWTLAKKCDLPGAHCRPFCCYQRNGQGFVADHFTLIRIMVKFFVPSRLCVKTCLRVSRLRRTPARQAASISGFRLRSLPPSLRFRRHLILARQVGETSRRDKEKLCGPCVLLRPEESLRFGIFLASRRKGQAGSLCYPARKGNPCSSAFSGVAA
jgi:hypothetical protein